MRLDGLAPHDFIVEDQSDIREAAILKLSEDALLTQHKFLQLHGSGRNGRKTDLPRRNVAKLLVAQDCSEAAQTVQPGKESLQSLKRKRHQQIRTIEPRPGQEDSRLEAAAAASLGHATAETKHGVLAKKLQQLGRSKKKLFSEEIGGDVRETARKYEKAKAAEAAVREELESWQRSGFRLHYLDATPADRSSVLVLAEQDAKVRGLEQLGVRVLRWTGSVADMEMALQAKYLIWLSTSPDAESEFVLPKTASEWIAASRLLGGYMGTSSWQRDCEQAGQIFLPKMHLQGQLAQKCEVFVHKSAGEKQLPVAKVVARSVDAASRVLPGLSWVLRRKWKHVKSKKALVLVDHTSLDKVRKKSSSQTQYWTQRTDCE